MPSRYPHVVTPPDYFVKDSSYQLPLPQYATYSSTAPYPCASVPGAIYQQPQYYMPEVEYGSSYSRSTSSSSSSSMRGIGSYSSNGTTFFMPNIPVDHGDFIKHHQQQSYVQPLPEPVTGGVSATLDYDVDQMAEFVSTMALSIMHPTSVKAGQHSQELAAVHKFTFQVLTATRMPKSTIILALVYLSKRWALGQVPTTTSPIPPTYKMMVVALLLANKFNDDNTFTNSSWHEATGIPVRDLSFIESDWLKIIKWSLHLNQHDRKGWDKWNETWEYWVSTRKATRYNASRSTYQMAPNPSMPSVVSSERVRQLLSSPPSYTVPKWYEAASETRPPSLSSSMGSMDSNHSMAMQMNPSGHFASYFQQSFAGNPEYDHSRCASYYVPTHGAAGCYCNTCSFPVPKWYSGAAATAC